MIGQQPGTELAPSVLELREKLHQEIQKRPTFRYAGTPEGGLNPVLEWCSAMHGASSMELDAHATNGIDAVLCQYAQFPKRIVELLRAVRDAVEEEINQKDGVSAVRACGRAVVHELTRNIGEELGSRSTDGKKHYEQLRDNLRTAIDQNPDEIDPGFATRSFLDRLQWWCGVPDATRPPEEEGQEPPGIWHRLGATYALEATASPELQVVKRLVRRRRDIAQDYHENGQTSRREALSSAKEALLEAQQAETGINEAASKLQQAEVVVEEGERAWNHRERAFANIREFLTDHIDDFEAGHEANLLQALEPEVLSNQRDFEHGFQKVLAAMRPWWEHLAELLVQGSRSQLLMEYLDKLLYTRENRVEGALIDLGLETDHGQAFLRDLLPKPFFFGQRALPCVVIDLHQSESGNYDVPVERWRINGGALIASEEETATLSSEVRCWADAEDYLEEVIAQLGGSCRSFAYCMVVDPYGDDEVVVHRKKSGEGFFHLGGGKVPDSVGLKELKTKLEASLTGTSPDADTKDSQLRRVQAMVFLFAEEVPPLTPTRRLMASNLLSELAAEIQFSRREDMAHLYGRASWFAHEVKNWTIPILDNLSYSYRNVLDDPASVEERLLNLFLLETILNRSSYVVDRAYRALSERAAGKSSWRSTLPIPVRSRRATENSLLFYGQLLFQARLMDSPLAVSLDPPIPPLKQLLLRCKKDPFDDLIDVILDLFPHPDQRRSQDRPNKRVKPGVGMALLLREAMWNIRDFQDAGIGPINVMMDILTVPPEALKAPLKPVATLRLRQVQATSRPLTPDDEPASTGVENQNAVFGFEPGGLEVGTVDLGTPFRMEEGLWALDTHIMIAVK